MKAIKKGVVFLSFFVFLFTTLPVSAQTVPTPTPTILAPTPCVATATAESDNCVMVNQEELGFSIPSLSDVLTFGIRGFFILGGLAALVFLLLGAFSWITSGGEKERVHEAQQKIQAAILGLIMIVVVLAIVVTLEQVVFGGKLCFGISCPITIPTLLEAPGTPPSNNSSFTLIEADTPTPTPHTVKVVVATPTPTLAPVPLDINHSYPQVPDTGSGE